MTEAVPQHLTHTVAFNRKVNLGNYESADVTFFRQFDTPLGVSDDDWMAAADAAFFAVKEYVTGEVAQLSGDVTSADVVPITAAKSAPAQQQSTVAAVAEAFGDDQVTEVVPDTPPGGTTKGAEGQAWAQAHLAANPDKWWDNRPGKTNPKAPDFRHKDDKDWVIWPPR